jgi:GT2 family glycosyltransferase
MPIGMVVTRPRYFPGVLVKFDPEVRVHLGVVTLGAPPRLRDCVASLTLHESRHEFVVSVLHNPVTALPEPVDLDLPPEVLVHVEQANLGWAGGLHRLRGLWRGELFVFVQDDMLVEAGWLDALVDAADAHPEIAGFGSLRVDEAGTVLLNNGGRAEPLADVRGWNAADETDRVTPTEVTVMDWVTSKGMLTRASVFDEVGGPDPSLWPLHHVDKDYCTHLRCHGYDVALVPGARLVHGQSQSAPTQFRQFMAGWRDPQFADRWTEPLRALGDSPDRPVEHPCAQWRDLAVDAVEAAAGREASRMLVPFSRFAAQGNAALSGQVERLEQAVAVQEQRRVRRARTLRREIRRLRRELDAVRAPWWRRRLGRMLR